MSKELPRIQVIVRCHVMERLPSLDGSISLFVIGLPICPSLPTSSCIFLPTKLLLNLKQLQQRSCSIARQMCTTKNLLVAAALLAVSLLSSRGISGLSPGET
eukprot:766408-Hanusia_phi.AAC.5